GGRRRGGGAGGGEPLTVTTAPNGAGRWSDTRSSVVMPDSPVASAPSQNAASSSRVVRAAGASEPSARWNGGRGSQVPPTVSSSNPRRARSPRSLSVPHAKHVRETGKGSQDAEAASLAPASPFVPSTTRPAPSRFFEDGSDSANVCAESVRARWSASGTPRGTRRW